MHVNTRYINSSVEDVPLVMVMYLVFTHTPDESYRRQLGSLLLYLCYIFQALINSLAFPDSAGALMQNQHTQGNELVLRVLVLFQISDFCF